MFEGLADRSIQKRTFHDWFKILFLSLAIVIVSCGIFSPPATALLRQHHETPNVLRYHAQDSLKDDDDNTWQVLLFPDYTQGQEIVYYLRLVGFPGVNAFKHPQSLEIVTAEGKILTVKDAYPQSAPAPNVGQYDLTSIIGQISAKQSLKLSLPLKNSRKLALKIPQEVLTEWDLLTREIER